MRIRQQLMQEAHQVVEEVIQEERPDIPMPPKPSDHTVLEIWSTVLQNIEGGEDERVTTNNAFRLLMTYPFLVPGDLPFYYRIFYATLKQYRDLLDYEIVGDENCFNWTLPPDDASHNEHHYRNLLVNWQRLALQMRMDWDCEGPFPGAALAALSDAQSFMLGEKGIVNLLGQIPLGFDQGDLNEVYELAVEGYEQEG